MHRPKLSCLFIILLVLNFCLLPVVHYCHGHGGHSHSHDAGQCDCLCHHADAFSHDSKTNFLEWLHLSSSKWIGFPSDQLHKKMFLTYPFTARAPPLTRQV